MKLFSSLLVLALAVPATGSAQTIDAGTDLTGYTRFIVYPHLQKALESMQRGDRNGALTEFERARSLAPTNATVALHLASAYQRFGELPRAESLLRAQIALTPADARLPRALTALQAAMAPRAAAAASVACSDNGGPRCNDRPAQPDRPANTASSAAPVTTTARPVAPRREKAQQVVPVAPAPAAPVERSDDTPQFSAAFTVALQRRDF